MGLDRITFDPKVMGGKPCIRGLRVTVGTIVGLIAAGKSFGEIPGSPSISSVSKTKNTWPKLTPAPSAKQP